MTTHNARTLLERLEDPLFLDMPSPKEAAAEIRGWQERLANVERELAAARALLEAYGRDSVIALALKERDAAIARANLGTAKEPK